MIEQGLARGCREEGGERSIPTLRELGQLSSGGVIIHSSIPQPHEPDSQDLSVGGPAHFLVGLDWEKAWCATGENVEASW